MRIGLVALIVLAVVGVSVQAETIQLRVLKALGESTNILRENRTIGNKLYGDGYLYKTAGLLSFDWQTGEVKALPVTGYHQVSFFGDVGGNLVLATRKGLNQLVWGYAVYNLQTHKTKRATIDCEPLFGFENGLAFGSCVSGQGPGLVLSFYDSKTDTLSRFKSAGVSTAASRYFDGGGNLIGISSDRMHLLVNIGYVSSYNGPFDIVRTSDGKIDGTFQSNNQFQKPQFVGNSAIFDGTNLWSIDGKRIGEVRFRGVLREIFRLLLSPNLSRAIVQAYTGGANSTGGSYYVDSTAFRNYLDKLGYLFHPTTGVMTSSEVNFRRYPNLKAKVIGTLNTGEKLIVLDRSGAKQKIEGYDSYWYKVKTSGGTVGWMYGAFIKLAKP